jgi:OOP family OmpA-OmpF porin
LIASKKMLNLHKSLILTKNIKMKKLLLLGMSAVLGFGAVAQDDDKNLVLNPSFEAYGKLKKLNSVKMAENWSSPTTLGADLFSTEKEGLPCSAPQNPYGKEYPMDGKAYAGIVMYSYNNKQPRTYIQTQLESPLRKGVEYCIKYHVSLADLSKYSVNNFGVYFGKDPLEVAAKADIIFDKEKDREQVALPIDNRKYNARYNWEPVCATYTASGKEAYITIGNFYNNKETDYEKLKPLANYKGTQIPTAYYYIDQVEIFIMEDPSECDCNIAETEIEGSVVYHKEYTSEDGFSIEDQVKLGTIYFDVESGKIESNMSKDLEILAGSMKANPEYKLTLHGHLDSNEGSKLRQNPDDIKVSGLDTKRAEAVKAALVANGLSADRISVEAHKDKDQDAFGTTSLDHAKNRRVEFTLEK